MSAPTAQPAQPDQSAPLAHQVARQAQQALLVQPALKAPPGSGGQPACKGQRVLPAPLAQMAPRAPQGLRELAALLAFKVRPVLAQLVRLE